MSDAAYGDDHRDERRAAATAASKRQGCYANEGNCKAADCPEHGYLPRAPAAPHGLTEVAPKRSPRIVLSIHLDDGSFDATLAVATDAGPEALRETAESWMMLLEKALKAARSRS